MEGSIKPWQFTAETVQMDQKGKIQFLHPELRGPAQCPFWKTLKAKIAANLKEGVDDGKVPKSFAIEVGKEYKVPLDPTYTTPVCIGAKICAHFRGVSKGVINCDFKLGVKAGPEKKVDVASTTEPVPPENKVEAPVKEEVGIERGSVPAVSESEGRFSIIKKNNGFELKDSQSSLTSGPYPTEELAKKAQRIANSTGALHSLDALKKMKNEHISEAKKCPKCGKPQKENTEGNDKYCQGHEVEERIASTSATPLVGLTDSRPGNYPEDTMAESRYSRYAQTDEQEELIQELERTLAQLGKSIVGGTTIGKSPQTVILDLTHQGSQIYINASNEARGRDAQVKINGVVVDPTDIESVKAAIEVI